MSVRPFALRDRWIITVESERALVKVRHRTRWYVVERRSGHETRAHWCSTRRDALAIANMLRRHHEKRARMEKDPAFQHFRAWYEQQPESRRADIRKDFL